MKKRILIIGLFFVLCVVSFSPMMKAGNWYNQSWEFSRIITIDSDYVNSDLTDFPVLVKLDNSFGTYRESLRFTLMDNVTLLDHEVDYWSNTSTSYIWVRLPHIDSSVNTSFCLFYSNNGVSNIETSNTWNSDYRLVYHCNSDGLDSTSNNNDGTFYNGVTNVTGEIGNANYFDGTNDYISIANSSSLVFDDELFIFVLYKEIDDAGMLISKDYRFYELKIDQSNSVIFLGDDSGDNYWGKTQNSMGYDDTSNVYRIFSIYADVNNLDIWNNETLIQSDVNPDNNDFNNFPNVKALEIARRSGSADYFNGYIDEIRLCSKNMTTDYINATYQNIFSYSNFLEVGLENDYDDTYESLRINLSNEIFVLILWIIGLMFIYNKDDILTNLFGLIIIAFISLYMYNNFDLYRLNGFLIISFMLIGYAVSKMLNKIIK